MTDVPDALQERSTREVFEDHLQLAMEGDFEKDIARNLHQDAVILSARGIHRGHAGAKQLADLLGKELPHAVFRYTTRVVDGEYALLEWTGRGGGRRVDDGSDSFHIRNGKIVMQSLHYTVLPD